MESPKKSGVFKRGLRSDMWRPPNPKPMEGLEGFRRVLGLGLCGPLDFGEVS